MREREGRGGEGAKVHVLLSTIILPQDPRGGRGSVTASDLPGHRASTTYLPVTTESQSDVMQQDSRSGNGHGSLLTLHRLRRQ